MFAGKKLKLEPWKYSKNGFAFKNLHQKLILDKIHPKFFKWKVLNEQFHFLSLSNVNEVFKTLFEEILALAICSSLERSDVTFFKWRSLQVTSLPWPSARHFRSDVTSQNFWNFFFMKTFEIAQNAKKKWKKDFKNF